MKQTCTCVYTPLGIIHYAVQYELVEVQFPHDYNAIWDNLSSVHGWWVYLNNNEYEYYDVATVPPVF